MKRWQWIRIYAAVLTGVILSALTVLMLWRMTRWDILQIGFVGMWAFTIGASGFMALTEQGRKRKVLLEQKIRNAGRRRSQCYIYSAVGRIESQSCGDGLVEYRDKVTDFVPEFSDNKKLPCSTDQSEQGKKITTSAV